MPTTPQREQDEPHTARHAAVQSPSAPGSRAQAPLEMPAWLRNLARPSGATVLGHDEFLDRLRLEKRRVDRSEAPLSLVLFRPLASAGSPVSGGPTFNTLHDTPHIRASALMSRLRTMVRETDLLGLLDSGDCAVLLPDTDAQGRRGFIARIAREMHAAGGLELSTASATYPDRLFENLDAGREAVPLGSLMLDETTPATRCGYAGKRLLDLVGAGFALVALAPLMAAVALAVAAGSRGPVIFRQVRLGRGGAPFEFYKFRTMVHDADDRVHREYVARLIREGSPAPVEGGFKLHADPRITPLGHFLRRTSLDELPQFFNVLRGDMSLVGPRPPIPYEARHYRAWHLRRLLAVKPGITGPWQVAGRSRVPFDEMVRMDLRYIARCSLALDLWLLLRTLAVVWRGEGAR